MGQDAVPPAEAGVGHVSSAVGSLNPFHEQNSCSERDLESSGEKRSCDQNPLGSGVAAGGSEGPPGGDLSSGGLYSPPPVGDSWRGADLRRWVEVGVVDVQRVPGDDASTDSRVMHEGRMDSHVVVQMQPHLTPMVMLSSPEDLMV